MKIIAVLLLAITSLCAAEEPQNFTASRSVQRSFEDVKAAVQTYCAAAKTNHPAIWIGGTKEEAGRFVQTWMDCAGAPPGALTGEIIVTRGAGLVMGTHIEVCTDATRPQDKVAAERRRERTKKTLEEIVNVLERKP